MPANNLAIKGTDLRWKRMYDRPGTMSRDYPYCDIEVDGGTYRLRRLKHNKTYRVSWIPTSGDEIDLGGYRLRRDCDERVRKHRDTGR